MEWLGALLSRAAAGTWVSVLTIVTAAAAAPPPIDRRALVSRHNPSLTRVDPSAPLMVGNGELALTADITGLSTFRRAYSPRAPLMIAAQWAWHSFPNPQNYRYEQSLVPVDVRGQTLLFPWLHDWAEAKKPEIDWLRKNPHRFSPGRLGLWLERAEGQAVELADLTNTQQTLDLWRGTLESRFTFEGQDVSVSTSVHPERDIVIVELRSALLARGRLGVELSFSGVSSTLNPDPTDETHPEAHRTLERQRGPRGVTFERQLDAARYWVEVLADRDVEIRPLGPHHYRITPRAGERLTLLTEFSEERPRTPLPEAAAARDAVSRRWARYWSEGGAVDFSGSRDPRAHELERRVVLSQYLMALNAAGRVPPQEEGLFSNSWNGKFHLEMHPWHAAHFATWGHPELLERSLPWYLGQLPAARARARGYGARGAWWPKMVGPEGRESPSTITPFIMWQQPHPIYLAELLYRAKPGPRVLERYRELVFDTAELLASFPHLDVRQDRYVLGPPIIPAQEVFPPLVTWNPTFELAYFRYGLQTAQLWRERLGLGRNPEWDRVLDKLAPLPQKDGLYLATESQPGLWTSARTPGCSRQATRAECINRDHPSFVAALGLLPGAGVDREVMRRTLHAVLGDWDLRQTWGWDFPMLAMTAARLNEPETAVSLLLGDAINFRFGLSGMTPRVHVDPTAGDDGPDGPGSRRDAETYFPSNGALLLAVGMMAAGWDGSSEPYPGFPRDGSWVVQSEGLTRLP